MSADAPHGEVAVVVSRPGTSGGEREFQLDSTSAPGAPDLPAGLTHESELVAWMAGRGWGLTMIGGGARGDEVRRFYFRRRSPVA